VGQLAAEIAHSV